jgi:hypothetical protein
MRQPTAVHAMAHFAWLAQHPAFAPDVRSYLQELKLS